MGRVSQKCTSSSGDGSSKNGEGSGSSWTATDSVSMVETYAIAASKTGAVVAVNAIEAAEPVPELKGETTAIKACVVAIIKWLKSISKHQIVKALGDSIGRSGAQDEQTL